MRNRDHAGSQALLLAVGALDLAKGLYFLRHYPQAAPFDAYYNVGLRLMRDLAASRSASDLVEAVHAMKGLAYLGAAGILYGPWAALRPGVSWLMTNIMQDVLNKGTAARARA